MRLVAAGLGAYTILYGYAKVKKGLWFYKNHHGLDVPALFVASLGVLFLLFAVFPWGRIRFLWDSPRPGKKRRR